jgi:hypothetical protein
MIDGYHRLSKLREYSAVDFDLHDADVAQLQVSAPPE